MGGDRLRRAEGAIAKAHQANRVTVTHCRQLTECCTPCPHLTFSLSRPAVAFATSSLSIKYDSWSSRFSSTLGRSQIDPFGAGGDGWAPPQGVDEYKPEAAAAAVDQDKVGVADIIVVEAGRVDGGRASRATSVRTRRKSSANSVSDWTHRLNRRLRAGRSAEGWRRVRNSDGRSAKRSDQKAKPKIRFRRHNERSIWWVAQWPALVQRNGGSLPFEDLDLHEAHVLRSDVELWRERYKVLQRGAGPGETCERTSIE